MDINVVVKDHAIDCPGL